MTVRHDPISGEIYLSLSGSASKHAEALAAIVDALGALDSDELQRVISFARELNQRGEREFVWFGVGPADVSADDAIMPADILRTVWRGRPQTYSVSNRLLLKGPLAQPAIIHFHEREQGGEKHPAYSCLVLGPDDTADSTKFMRYSASSLLPAHRAQRGHAEDPAPVIELPAETRATQGTDDDDIAWNLRRELLSESIPVAQAAERIRRTEQTAINRARAKEMLGVRDGVRWMFPAWQFEPKHESGLVPGLADVLQAVDAPPFSVALWLRAPSDVLNARRPIDVLRSGEIETVITAARSLGTQ